MAKKQRVTQADAKAAIAELQTIKAREELERTRLREQVTSENLRKKVILAANGRIR